MRVTEHLENATDPLISFEILPPKRGGDLTSLMQLIDDLAAHRPPFIDITSHAAEMVHEETATGLERRIKRKRPGTLGVCALIQHKYGVDAVPHVVCEGFNREETEDFLIELHYLGIDNVLAIRGDSTGFEKKLEFGRSRNQHATDLIDQIAKLNKGIFLEELLDSSPTDFAIGAAGYPEKHFESPNLETDVRWVKSKVEAGAGYIVTQMFFDNQHFYSFVEECRRQGITVPIIPGLKLITSKAQLATIPRTFHCDVPQPLVDEIQAVKPERVRDVGVAWALDQTRDLLRNGIPSVHFYVMGNSQGVNQLLGQLDL
ncbi:MAG: methylenetetrahydrofolate reductase [Actinomycetota bacterium]|nr:methylenetetrahydrofolate reductase [Actinomycetota bacterium]